MDSRRARVAFRIPHGEFSNLRGREALVRARACQAGERGVAPERICKRAAFGAGAAIQPDG